MTKDVLTKEEAEMMRDGMSYRIDLDENFPGKVDGNSIQLGDRSTPKKLVEAFRRGFIGEAQ